MGPFLYIQPILDFRDRDVGQTTMVVCVCVVGGVLPILTGITIEDSHAVDDEDSKYTYGLYNTLSYIWQLGVDTIYFEQRMSRWFLS